MDTVWERLDALLETYDADFEVSVASATTWSGQLRLTLTNPTLAPSRSVTFYTVSGAEPAEVAEALLDDAERWMRESGVTPMAVPAWMKDDGDRD